MDEQKRQQLINRIKEMKEIIESVKPDNPNIPRWKKEIEKLREKMKELEG